MSIRAAKAHWTRTGTLRGLVHVVGLIRWLVFGDFGKNLLILILI
jgi:hypothetical protein